MARIVPLSQARKYPVIKDTLRPYRFWNTTTRRYMPYRNYVNEKRAVDAARSDAAYQKVGFTLEVVDVTRGRLMASFTKRVNGSDEYLNADFRAYVRSWLTKNRKTA